MAQKKSGATPGAGNDRDGDLSGIETEIDEALEDVDDEEVDERLDEALKKADQSDPDGALIELEGIDEDDEDVGEGDTGEKQGRKGAGKK